MTLIDEGCCVYKGLDFVMLCAIRWNETEQRRLEKSDLKLNLTENLIILANFD